MMITLFKISDLYDGEKLIKKNIITRVHLETDQIDYPEELFNEKGQVIHTKSRVFLKDYGPIIVTNSFDEIINIMNKKSPTIGFVFKDKNKKVKNKITKKLKIKNKK